MRLIAYAFYSKGKSLPVSLGLISFEVSIIPLAIFYDFWAQIRFKSRIPEIMQLDFISMNKTPVFKSKASDIPSQNSFNFLNVNQWRKEVSKLIKENQWKEAYQKLEEIRTELNQENPGSHFLCKHFLESVHLAVANTYNWSLSSPECSKSFMKHRAIFIWWQAVGYEGAQVLDWLAFKIHQNQNIPILINDVPAIPVPHLKG